MDFFQRHADTLLLCGLVSLQALQGYLAFEVSMNPQSTNHKRYRWAFVIVTIVGIFFSVVVTRKNGSLEYQMATEIHSTAGKVNQMYDLQIGHAPSMPAKVENAKPKATPSPKVSTEITAVFSHGDTPPPSRRILKLWVTVKNAPNGPPSLVNEYGLTIKIPGNAEFIGHPTSPFSDDAHFVSLETQTGNQPIQPGGEVQGNLMFVVEDFPIAINADPNIQFTLSARANGMAISKTETIAEIGKH